MSTREVHEDTEPESWISTLTVVCDPPDTITPSHQTLEPPFICNLMPLSDVEPEDEPEEEGVGVVVGVLVGVLVGVVVGTTVADPVVEEDEPAT